MCSSPIEWRHATALLVCCWPGKQKLCWVQQKFVNTVTRRLYCRTVFIQVTLHEQAARKYSNHKNVQQTRFHQTWKAPKKQYIRVVTVDCRMEWCRQPFIVLKIFQICSFDTMWSQILSPHSPPIPTALMRRSNGNWRTRQESRVILKRDQNRCQDLRYTCWWRSWHRNLQTDSALFQSTKTRVGLPTYRILFLWIKHVFPTRGGHLINNRGEQHPKIITLNIGT